MDSGTNPNRRSWVLGGLLITIGALFLMWQLIPATIAGALIPITILGGIGVTFLAVYLNDRDHWWALIPSYVMFTVAGIIFFAGILMLPAMVVWSYILFSIAVPFLYVFVRNRDHWWALLPAGVTASVGAGLLVGATAGFIFPAISVLMIIFGIYLLIRNMNGGNRKLSSPVQTPTEERPIEYEPIRQITGPEADKPRR